MFSFIFEWIERRRQLRRLWKEDARQLIARNPDTAYYDAQRAAARARFAGDGDAFHHWAKVAAEVARTGDTQMDLNVIRQIVDEEERRAAVR